MIFGIGCDIIETKRIELSINKFRERFLHRIFTKQEIDYCNSKKKSSLHFAVRFAAKESFVKALGTGFDGNIGWNEIEIINNSAGKPQLKLNGNAKDKVEKLGIKNMNVTLSHVTKNAIAVVILEK